MKDIFVWISIVRLIPHIIAWRLVQNRDMIDADIRCFAKAYGHVPRASILEFGRLMTFRREFRNVFYMRLSHRSSILPLLIRVFCRPMPTLMLPTADVGPGLFIQHGFSTIVAARRIGANCWINQQVTIGYSNATDHPTLGDHVHVYAGAKVIGNVVIGDNVKVGANAVVVKDVPSNCTVVGVPARIVRQRDVEVSTLNSKS